MTFAEKLMKDMQDCKCGQCSECEIRVLRGVVKKLVGVLEMVRVDRAGALWADDVLTETAEARKELGL